METRDSLGNKLYGRLPDVSGVSPAPQNLDSHVYKPLCASRRSPRRGQGVPFCPGHLGLQCPASADHCSRSPLWAQFWNPVLSPRAPQWSRVYVPDSPVLLFKNKTVPRSSLPLKPQLPIRMLTSLFFTLLSSLLGSPSPEQGLLPLCQAEPFSLRAPPI